MHEFRPAPKKMNLPEPIEDFDSERNQVQFDLEADEDVDIKWNLQIDELTAQIGSSGDIGFNEVSELLWAFCYRRSYRFNWLKEKAWEIGNLRLFLEFLHCWENNQEWWEVYFYNQWLDSWQPVWSRGSLSLDSCYLLVQLRNHCTPEEVIDQEWFEDWHEHELWAKGFTSFSSYALFRAELGDHADRHQQIAHNYLAEEWPEKAGEYSNELLERTGELSLAELIDRRLTLPEWLLHQDWYSGAEWLDNLN